MQYYLEDGTKWKCVCVCVLFVRVCSWLLLMFPSPGDPSSKEESLRATGLEDPRSHFQPDCG